MRFIHILTFGFLLSIIYVECLFFGFPTLEEVENYQRTVKSNYTSNHYKLMHKKISKPQYIEPVILIHGMGAAAEEMKLTNGKFFYNCINRNQ